jgi:GTP:adenosylcobinamide-phosphate guanylyltransferase
MLLQRYERQFDLKWGGVMTGCTDAIILAGDRKGSRDIAGKSKLLLEVGEKPLLAYVIEALDKVERVQRIVIIGPRDLITDIVLACGSRLSQNTRIDVLEQLDTAYQNFWAAFIHTLDQYEPGQEEQDEALLEKPVLVVPADIPLISAQEVNEFLDGATRLPLDYGIGMTASEHLERFYPHRSEPGIRMTYLHVAESDLRLNNLHFIRPFKVKNRAYIEEIYEFRYQKELLNVLRVVLDILRTPGFGLRPVYLYAMLQLSIMFSALNLQSCLKLISARVKKEDMTNYASVMLRAKVVIIETTGGGCAVDVDSERDYLTINQRFEEYSHPVD